MSISFQQCITYRYALENILHIGEWPLKKKAFIWFYSVCPFLIVNDQSLNTRQLLFSFYKWLSLPETSLEQKITHRMIPSCSIWHLIWSNCICDFDVWTKKLWWWVNEIVPDIKSIFNMIKCYPHVHDDCACHKNFQRSF